MTRNHIPRYIALLAEIVFQGPCLRQCKTSNVGSVGIRSIVVIYVVLGYYQNALSLRGDVIKIPANFEPPLNITNAASHSKAVFIIIS